MVNRITGNKVVGINQVMKELMKDNGLELYIALDADKKLIEPIINLASDKSIKINYVDTMKELGKMCGFSVKASTTLILK